MGGLQGMGFWWFQHASLKYVAAYMIGGLQKNGIVELIITATWEVLNPEDLKKCWLHFKSTHNTSKKDSVFFGGRLKVHGKLTCWGRLILTQVKMDSFSIHPTKPSWKENIPDPSRHKNWVDKFPNWPRARWEMCVSFLEGISPQKNFRLTNSPKESYFKWQRSEVFSWGLRCVHISNTLFFDPRQVSDKNALEQFWNGGSAGCNESPLNLSRN